MTHPPGLSLQPPAEQLVPSRVPTAAWALAVSCVAEQLLQLGEVGPRPIGPGMAVSVVIGGLLIRWVAFGVLTGRTVRLVIAWVVLVPVLLADGLEAVNGGADTILGWPGVQCVASVAAVASLAWFSTTDYFAWQRRRPQTRGPSLAPLLALAVVVGLLGGVVNTPDTGPGNVRMRS